LNIVDKLKEEVVTAKITFLNINVLDAKSDLIEISLKNLGLVENQTEKIQRNKFYFSFNSSFGNAPKVNFPVKELYPEEIEEGKKNGKKFLKFIKNNLAENYVIQVVNKCYRNKLSEFKEVEMIFLFVDLNL